MAHPDLSLWERASRPADDSHYGSPPHRKTSLSVSAPAARLIEVQRELEMTRQHLAAACSEVRRLDRDWERWHTFAGTSFSGIRTAQYWTDFVLWEMLLNTYRHVVGIVEFGTWNGGFSRYLHAQAACRGLSFRTYDVLEPAEFVPDFVQSDIYRDAEEIGAWLSRQGPIFLFCDGGNKPREIATFPPYCHKDSIVLVHDWGTETLPSDVPEFLIPMHEDTCDEMGSVTRVFRIAQ